MGKDGHSFTHRRMSFALDQGRSGLYVLLGSWSAALNVLNSGRSLYLFSGGLFQECSHIRHLELGRKLSGKPDISCFASL